MGKSDDKHYQQHNQSREGKSQKWLQTRRMSMNENTLT
jgi:hypothetical protein